ncbi:MAG: hypothetical protein OEN55_03735 [Alphaproteobacteria bacterium]|nr:hypothetical protein [Alphaproteobacteria bacterium]
MHTTPIIVEILIVGIQGMVWVILLALGLFPGLSAALPVDSAIKPAIAVAFVGLAYSLGVILDRLIRLVFANLVPSSPIRFLTRLALVPAERAEYTKAGLASAKEQKRLYRARIKIQLYQPDAMAVIEMIRSRVRIARATAFNAFVTMFAALFYIYYHTVADLHSHWLPAIGIVAGGVLVISLSLMAYGVLDWHYRYRKDQMLKVLEAKAGNKPQ